MDVMLEKTPISPWEDLPGGPSAIKPFGYKLGYDSAHPKWNEPLVDLAARGLLTKSWYATADGSNPPYNQKIAGSIGRVLARAGAADLCVIADKAVQNLGLRLLFVDGYRSPETQQGLWQFFEEKIRKRSPGLSDQEVYKETSVYVSPGRISPHDPETWFVHATGGSVDALLYDPARAEILDCGVGFDDDTPAVFTHHYENLCKAGKIPEDAAPLVNRRIIYNAMTAAGFTNYPYEYFHYDYGTILHSARRKIAEPDLEIKAWYGLASMPL